MKGDWDFLISDRSKTLMELIFSTCGEFWWNPEDPVGQIPWDLFTCFKVCSDAERNGKLPHLSIPSKTAAWAPEFAVEDLPLSRTVALVPEFAVKDLLLGRILWWWWYSVKLVIPVPVFLWNYGKNHHLRLLKNFGMKVIASFSAADGLQHCQVFTSFS